MNDDDVLDENNADIPGETNALQIGNINRMRSRSEFEDNNIINTNINQPPVQRRRLNINTNNEIDINSYLPMINGMYIWLIYAFYYYNILYFI